LLGLVEKTSARLYQIEGKFEHDDWIKVKKAFIEKYGDPSADENMTLKNTYTGVKTDMENLVWRKGHSSIDIQEFDNNFGNHTNYDLEISTFSITYLRKGLP
jgi:hypothetical protein